jgi:cell wall-associated NlpC family hydrolase
MSKQTNFQIFLIALVLLTIVSLANAQTCPGIKYATGGCGGVGGGGTGPSNIPAVSCRQCACWCGWAECCYKPEGETSKAAGRADWLFSFSRKLCSCSSPAASRNAAKSPRTTPPTKEEVQSVIARSLGKFQYRSGGNAFKVGIDGIAETNCAGMTSYWWHELGLPDLGNVGTQFTDADLAPYIQGGITMGQLNPGDIILYDTIDSTGNLTGNGHVGMYIGDGLVAHMMNELDDIVIDTVKDFYSYGNNYKVIRGY